MAFSWQKFEYTILSVTDFFALDDLINDRALHCFNDDVAYSTRLLAKIETQEQE